MFDIGMGGSARLKAEVKTRPPDLRRAAPFAVAVPALALLSWPVQTLPGANGTDLSWMGALHLAAQHGLHFGDDLVFTYGPLGFLQTPQPYYGWTSVASLGYLAIVQIGICFLVLRAASRALPLPVAVGVAHLATRSLVLIGAGSDQWHGLPEMSLILVFLACVEHHRPSGGQAGATTFPLVAGLMAGILLLGKFNVGVVACILLLTAVVAGSDRRIRPLVAFLLSSVATFLAAWVVLGQPLEDVSRYVSLSTELAVGYSAAMGADGGPSVSWQYGGFVLCASIVAVLGFDATHTWPRRRLIAVALLGVVLAFATFKGGFVRWHSDLVFCTSLLASFAFVARSSRRSLVVVSTAGLLVAVLAVAQIDVVGYLGPIPSLEAAADQVQTVLSASNRRAAYGRTVDTTRAAYGIDPETLALLKEHEVHFDPMESAIAVGYPEMRWRPLPVFQSFLVYTHELDQANALRLASDEEAPDRILRERPYAIDGRNPWWEGPQSTIEMLCRYRELRAYGRWQVLAREADLCGPGEVVQTIHTRTGRAVEIPAAYASDSLVVARVIGLNASPLSRLATSLFRAPEWYVAVGGAQKFRLVPGTAADGLLMSMPTSIDYSDDFAFGLPITAFSVLAGADNSGEQVDITVEIVRYPINVLSYSTAPSSLSPADTYHW